MIIDATNLIVGRLGTVVAKKVLLGEKVIIVNSEKAVITGKRPVVLAKFKQKILRGTWAKGPHFIRSPERLLKRMIRGMLPYKQARGLEAYKRIMCWVGTPDEFKGQKIETVKAADVSKMPNLDYVSLQELSKQVGGKFV
jgi:large subunit ribosomal protein L13